VGIFHEAIHVIPDSVSYALENVFRSRQKYTIAMVPKRSAWGTMEDGLATEKAEVTVEVERRNVRRVLFEQSLDSLSVMEPRISQQGKTAACVSI
jgi:hypothetical protein